MAQPPGQGVRAGAQSTEVQAPVPSHEKEQNRAASKQQPGCTGHLGARPPRPCRSLERAPHGPWAPRVGWSGQGSQEHLIELGVAQHRLVARGQPTQVSRGRWELGVGEASAAPGGRESVGSDRGLPQKVRTWLGGVLPTWEGKGPEWA